MKQNEIIYTDRGMVNYSECWDHQERLLQESVRIKMDNRTAEGIAVLPPHHLILCEHPHVFTLGKSGHEKHMLLNSSVLEKINATYYRINRGGDITYHGPGQLVGYPILDLDQFYNDIHLYLRNLEEVIIRTLAVFNISGGRIKGLTGVWLDSELPSARKICAFGVRCSRWVTMHGFALNVHPDLSYFSYIVPCGIPDKSVTSMEKELGQKVSMEEVKSVLLDKFADVFNCTITAAQQYTVS